MKISMMSLIMGEMKAKDIVSLAAECDMKGVDWITLHGEKPEDLRKYTLDAGLAIVGYTPIKDRFVNGEEGWLDQFKESVDEATRLGAKLMMVPPFPLKNQTSLADGRKKWIGYFQAALPIAQEAGITLTAESTGYDISPITTADEMLELLTQVPGLKLTFDNGNIATADDQVSAFHKLKPYIAHFHLKDWKIFDQPNENTTPKRCGKHFMDIPVGEGDLGLESYWKTVVAPEYDGFVNLEFLVPTPNDTMADVVRRVIKRLRTW